MPLPTLQLFALERIALDEAMQRGETLEEIGALVGLSRYAVLRRLRKHGIRLPVKKPPETHQLAAAG